jgi:hypothetical protein
VQRRKLDFVMGEVEATNALVVAGAVDVGSEKDPHSRAAQGTERSLERRPRGTDVIKEQKTRSCFDGVAQTGSENPLGDGRVDRGISSQKGACEV